MCYIYNIMIAYEAAWRKLVGLLLAVIVLGPCVQAARQSATTGKTPGTMTLSGCLQKANVKDRFGITGHDGKVYSLRSSSIKLADHVGHTVTVTGRLKRDPARNDYDFEGSEVNEEYGKKVLDPVDFEVTRLKAVGASCQ